MSLLSQNLKFLREQTGVSQGEFGSLFDCSRDNIMSYERGTEPKLKTIQRVANYFHTTIDTLFNEELGGDWTLQRSVEGDVHLICPPNCPPISKSEELGGQIAAEPIVRYYPDRTREVIMLTQEAAASISGVISGQERPEEASRVLLPAAMLGQSGQYYGFKVRNDSMHPTLYDGDWVIGRHMEPQEWVSMVSERIYIVSTREDGVKIKRIRNRLAKGGFLRCRSDNKHYPAFEVQEVDIVSLFEVKCRLSFNFPNEPALIQERMARLEDRMDDLEDKKQ